MNGFNYVGQHDVLLTDDYKVHIEEFRRGQDQFLLLHWQYLKWSPSVLRKTIAHWHALRRCVTAPLFALSSVDDDKWQRFVTRFGFKYLETVKCENGESRRLFIHVHSPETNDRIRQQAIEQPVY